MPAAGTHADRLPHLYGVGWAQASWRSDGSTCGPTLSIRARSRLLEGPLTALISRAVPLHETAIFRSLLRGESESGGAGQSDDRNSSSCCTKPPTRTCAALAVRAVEGAASAGVEPSVPRASDDLRVFRPHPRNGSSEASEGLFVQQSPRRKRACTVAGRRRSAAPIATVPALRVPRARERPSKDRAHARFETQKSQFTLSRSSISGGIRSSDVRVMTRASAGGRCAGGCGQTAH